MRTPDKGSGEGAFGAENVAAPTRESRARRSKMTDRRAFLQWVAGLPVLGRYVFPLPPLPIAIDARPTALYGQPDGRNNLVRIAVTGLDAPAARARVTDRRGTLVGTAGLLPDGASLAGEVWVPLSRAAGAEFQIEVEVGKQRAGSRRAACRL